MSAKQSKPSVVAIREMPSEHWRLKRLLPASLASAFVHAVLLALFLFIGPTTPAVTQADDALVQRINAEKVDAHKPAFDTLDIAPFDIENGGDIVYADARTGEVSVPGPSLPNEKPGFEGAPERPPVSIPPPGGFGNGQSGGVKSLIAPENGANFGLAGAYNDRGQPLMPGSFNGRGGASRDMALKTGGGSPASEVAVAAGLKWLIRQQLPDGRWMLNSPALADKDRAAEGNDIAGTALGLLPLLAAGKTHKPAKDNAYDKNIDKGLKFLLRAQDKNGYLGSGMYAHGLGTIALCEAYALSQDPALRRPAQNALNLIINTQHEAGGWRYGPAKTPGDLSISGWQMMALKSGQMAGLDVPAVAISRARSFLNSCADDKEGYGYVPGTPGTPRLTAVALLCRQYMENWGPSHPRMIKSINSYIKTTPPDRQDVYYYYYATQVMHHFGGEAWRDWNEKMRESLIQKQEKNQQSPNFGSWSPVGDPYGRAGGRLMMTSLNLLTLEVYYRYLPLYYRDAGYKMDDAVKKAL